MMKSESQNGTPNQRERILKFIRQFCEPEACAAMQFHQFANELGDRKSAEKVLKELWYADFVAPTNTENDPEDGALFTVQEPNIEEPIKDSTQFVLTSKGYNSVDPIFDPYPEIDSASEIFEPLIPQQIVITTEFINAKLLEEMSKNPRLMLSLTPRQFEEFVAELFLREGFDVELTPEKKDGGRDILAVSHNELGSHLYLAECKRYSPKNPVGVEYVRSLYGVLEAEKATHGIIATTSYFTKGAQAFSRDLKWRIGLKNYNDLKAWVKKCTSAQKIV